MHNPLTFCNLCRNFNKLSIHATPALSTFTHFYKPSIQQNNYERTNHGTTTKHAGLPVDGQFVRFYATKKKPLNLDFAGDLIAQKKLDGNDLFFPFKELGGLENESDIIKKICSLDFCDSKQRMYHREYETLKKINEYCDANSELERKIVRTTIHIRNMVPYCLGMTQDKKSKSELVIRIARRKKYLKLLRNEDYERFLWLLKELKIRYIPARKTTRVTRKQERINAAETKADEQMIKKEDEIRRVLEKEKEEYLKAKPQMLEEIENDIKEYGLSKKEILKNVENIRYAREQPPKVKRTGFASLKVWEKPKVPPRYFQLK